MPGRVVFLGLADVQPVGAFDPADCWTLNAYWHAAPWLIAPARIYQMHEGFRTHPCHVERPQRYAGWESYYRAAIAGGTRLISPDADLLPGCEHRPLASFGDDWPRNFFGSTLGYMFADAFAEGFEEIELRGISMLVGEERNSQAHSLWACIMEAERRGVQTVAPQWLKAFWRTGYDRWESAVGSGTVAWDAIGGDMDIRYGDRNKNRYRHMTINP